MVREADAIGKGLLGVIRRGHRERPAGGVVAGERGGLTCIARMVRPASRDGIWRGLADHLPGSIVIQVGQDVLDRPLTLLPTIWVCRSWPRLL